MAIAPPSDNETPLDRFPDGTTGKTTSHLTKAASCQVIGYSHSTWLPKGGNQVAGYLSISDGTTGETTSHPTKQPEDGCQVVGYCHSTKLAKNASQVAGYPPAWERDSASLREFHANSIFGVYRIPNLQEYEWTIASVLAQGH